MPIPMPIIWSTVKWVAKAMSPQNSLRFTNAPLNMDFYWYKSFYIEQRLDVRRFTLTSFATTRAVRVRTSTPLLWTAEWTAVTICHNTSCASTDVYASAVDSRVYGRNDLPTGIWTQFYRPVVGHYFTPTAIVH